MRDDDPFDEFFNEIERMMNEVFGANAEFRFEHNAGGQSTMSPDVHLDIHETEENLRIVADVPGVNQDDIDLKCDGTTLMLDAEGGDRTYSERVSLPAPVDERSADATYNNGVLEVVFDRTDDSTTIDI